MPFRNLEDSGVFCFVFYFWSRSQKINNYNFDLHAGGCTVQLIADKSIISMSITEKNYNEFECKYSYNETSCERIQESEAHTTYTRKNGKFI